MRPCVSLCNTWVAMEQAVLKAAEPSSECRAEIPGVTGTPSVVSRAISYRTDTKGLLELTCPAGKGNWHLPRAVRAVNTCCVSNADICGENGTSTHWYQTKSFNSDFSLVRNSAPYWFYSFLVYHMTRMFLLCILPTVMAAPRAADTNNTYKDLQETEGKSAGWWAQCPITCLLPPQTSWPHEKDQHKGDTAHHPDRNIY